MSSLPQSKKRGSDNVPVQPSKRRSYKSTVEEVKNDNRKSERMRLTSHKTKGSLIEFGTEGSRVDCSGVSAVLSLYSSEVRTNSASHLRIFSYFVLLSRTVTS